MTIREYAKQVGFQIVGKLTRRPDLDDVSRDWSVRIRRRNACYMDEAQNEYYIGDDGCYIITADGGVI